MSKFAVVKMRIPMIVTKKIASFITVLALAFFSCTNCQKEPASLLAGTSWECKEDGSIMVFNDNHSGLYYCKSAIDDVYDEFVFNRAECSRTAYYQKVASVTKRKKLSKLKWYNNTSSKRKSKLK